MRGLLATVIVAGTLTLGCGGEEQVAPSAPAPGAAPAGREIVAVVNGDSVTADEMDAPIRIRLYDLARLQYETRLDRLQALAVEKILRPRAKAESLSLEAFIAREAEAFDTARRGSAGMEPLPPDGEDDEEAPPYLRRHRAAQRRAAYVRSVLDGAEVHILLEPPEPPRFDLRKTDGPVRGATDAPITIVGFIDYESPHARRAQPILRRLLDAYEGKVRFVVRDLPMRFHRNARLAAEAARCAGEQRAYWRYHDVLFQNQEALERPALDKYARRVALDAGAFGACLDDGRQGEAVTADVTEASRLGVAYVPTFFVNGLYLKGAQPFEAFRELIDAELSRLGLIAAPRGKGKAPLPEDHAGARESELPLVLVGTLVMGDPDRSTASIRHAEGEVASTYRAGSRVLENVELVKVERERVYLRNKGELEYLPLARGATGAATAAAQGAAAAAEEDEKAPAEEAGAERPLPEPEVILTLTRDEVDRGLDEREALEKSLRPGRLDLEGQRLLKLSEVPPGSLYEMLGLEPGDVLMRVNGEWITDTRNPLWDALSAPEGKVVLRFMRGGFPKAVEYRIE